MSESERELQEAMRKVLEFIRTEGGDAFAKGGFSLEQLWREEHHLTAERICQGTGLDAEIVERALDSLVANGKIKPIEDAGEDYYILAKCE